MNSSGGTLRPKRESTNMPSPLLTKEENESLFLLLGRKCITLSSAVVQLVLTSPPHLEWNRTFFGVACFVKDNLKRSYYIRVYDVLRQKQLWEQELYIDFQYMKIKPFFHCFEAEGCMAGLEFINDSEADSFCNAVLKKLNLRVMKRQEKYRRNESILPGTKSNAGHQYVPASRSDSLSSLPSMNQKSKKKSEKKKTITKADISGPTGFKHVQHVGFKSATGIAYENKDNVDNELAGFFNMVGISALELEDEETRKFIYEFINKNGGIDKVKQEINQPPTPPPVPARENLPTPKAVSRGVAPPLPPNRTTPMASPHHSVPPPPPKVAPPFPKGNAPPPPPPPPPMTFGRQQNDAAPAPPPPPPPPPFMMDGAIPSSGKAPGPPAPPAPPAMDGRGALLAQIQQGISLNEVKVSKEPKLDSSGGDSRGALLEQIQKGLKLKKVEVPKTDNPLPKPDGLGAALMKALDERRYAMHSDDDSDGSDSIGCDDDEWGEDD